MNHQVVIEFYVHRCFDCGRWWALEKFDKLGECPYCASNKRQLLVRDLETLKRTVAALKGAATRTRRKK